MTCAHRLWNEPNGLTCTRTDPHTTGHTYESTSAGDDRHQEGGHG